MRQQGRIGAMAPLRLWFPLFGGMLMLLGASSAASAGNRDTVAQCHGYARQGVEQFNEARNKNCEFSGGVWTDNYQAHFDFCRRAQSESVDRDVKKRVDALRNCDRCNIYATTAVNQTEIASKLECGHSGNVGWGVVREPHFRWCMGAKTDSANRDTNARAHFVRKCNECRGYATHALQQRERLLAKNPNCAGLMYGNAWGTYWRGHYTWCMGARESSIDREVKLRNDTIAKCGTPQYSDLGPQPNPAPAPAPAAAECKVSVEITAEKCCDGGSPPGECVPFANNIAEGKKAHGCGKDEQTALARAQAKWAMAQGPEPDYDDDGDDIPCQGCCLMEKKVVQGCMCGIGSSASPLQVACTGGMILVDGRCACPSGRTLIAGQCRVKAQPAPAPQPQQPRRCAGGMVGTPPDCSCPEGTRLVPRGRRRCVPIVAEPPKQEEPKQEEQPKQECRGGMVGTPPDCSCPEGTRLQRRRGRRSCIPIVAEPPKDCGPGYRPLDKPNKYGARCELIPVPGPQQPPPPPPQQCPPGLRGPNCDEIIVN